MTVCWWIIWLFLSIQLPAYSRILNEDRKDSIGEGKNHIDLDDNEVDPGSIVFPRVYHMSKRRRRQVEHDESMMEDSLDSSLLIIRSKNQLFYIEMENNKELGRIPIYFRKSQDEVQEISIGQDHTDCLKVGRILGQLGGVAAISTCDEDGAINGILLTKGEAYVLKPLSKIKPGKKPFKNKTLDSKKYLLPHVLLQHKEGLHFCGIDHNSGTTSKIYDLPDPDSMDAVTDTIRIGRVKRADANNRKVMEVAVFVDSELYARIEATSDVDPRRATIRRVLGIMNQVQMIYNYGSLDSKFKIVIVKLEILKENMTSPSKDKGNIDNYLDNFCNWQSKLNKRENRSGRWDHAVMLTGMDLYKEDDDGRKNSKVLGLAWVNGMCRSNYSCTLNEGTSFEAAFVIAHEMGHSLGVMHDGSGNNCDNNKYIMSDKTGPGKVNWSPCSNAYIKNFFRSGYGWCLEDDASPPNRSYDLEMQELPGLKYSLTDQCHLALGMDYFPHQDEKEPFNNVCRELWCASGSWAKPAHPALDGSKCGNDKQCRQGNCRKPMTRRVSNSSPTPITTRATRRTYTKNNYDPTFDWIDRLVIKMIKNLG